MTNKYLIIFEDNLVSNLNPLTLTRPAFELLCGMKPLWENIIKRMPDAGSFSCICRDYLKDVALQHKIGTQINSIEHIHESTFDNALLINGRIIASLSELPEIDGEEVIGLQDGAIAYARIKNYDKLASLMDSISDDQKQFIEKIMSLDVPKKEIKGIKFANYLWNLVLANGEAIEADFKFYAKPEESKGVIENGAFVRAKVDGKIISYGAEEASKLMKEGKIGLYIGEGTKIFPNVTIDITGGPAYIGAHIDVRPPSLIDGPCCMMDNEGTSKKTTIIDGGLIRSGCTLGPVCRVGGELEESIIQGYTNKHHAGFIGHAYLGEWVNVGAMATNSDLKNDLSDVKVPVNNQIVDSGDLKVGCFIGDHTKLGIGALLTTGTVVGIMTNVLSSGDLPPQYVPSFCFYRENRLSKGFRVKTLLETAERVMSRRNVKLTEADCKMLEKVYEMVEAERNDEVDKHDRRVDNEIFKLIKQYEKEKAKK
jgi:UDP-N-acetylglucosamine diphosphorylase/glucosamine-1-phosphate N-acetyltransferase